MKLDRIMTCLPHFCSGKVVKGFGRGSKDLGIPTGTFTYYQLWVSHIWFGLYVYIHCL